MQFLRPSATTISTRIASGDHTAIDEEIAQSADYVQTSNLSYGGAHAIFECKLSPPQGPPRPGDAVFSWRMFETGDGSGCEVSIHQGGALIDQVYQDLPSLAPEDFSFAPNLAAVTDWADLRARFEFWVPFAGSGIQARLHYAVLAVPDPIAGGMFLVI